MQEVYLHHCDIKHYTRLIPDVESKPTEPVTALLDRESAVSAGLEYALSLTHKVKDILISAEEIIIELENNSPILTRPMLEKIVLFIHTFKVSATDRWVKEYDGLTPTGLWQTFRPVRPISVSRIHMYLWLQNRRIKIKHSRF